MKTNRLPTRLAFLLATTLITGQLHAQLATWNNGGADNDWNNPLNWDIGVPAEGTNATIGAGFTVNYNAPMVATAIGSLTASSPLNVNATGLNVLASGNGATTINGSSAALLSVNNGGSLSVPNGGVTITSSAGAVVAAGGSLTASGLASLGSSSSTVGFLTNNGGNISVGGLRINPNNAASNARAVINGGSNYLGNVIILRSGSGSASFQTLGTEGLVINNGLVNLASVVVGSPGANSSLTMFVGGGTVTNTGNFIVGQVTGVNSRPARFLQTGGLVVSTIADGIRVGVSNSTQVAQCSLLGGTNFAERFLLGDGSNSSSGLTVSFTNAAKVYVGSGGVVSNQVNTLNVALNSGGVFGANANWSGNTPIILAGGAFDCGDLGGTAHDISLNGILRGTGALNKNGTGKLTVNAVNSYSGNTLVNAGTLALGATGSIATTPQITIAAGASLDVTAPGGFTLGSTRTLTGDGTVTGNLTVAGGGLVNPGASAGTLTITGSLTESGSAVNHFDLPTTPGPGNDLLSVGGDLNLTGVNTIEIVGGGSPGTVHTLIQYGGNLNGTLANFLVSGASGTLSNNPTTKTIAFVVAAAIRTPTNVVWVGNSSVNDWDTVNRTNWLNVGTGLIDYFVTGDNVLFDSTGAANSVVNVVGNNSPASLTVGATANYTFGGSGAISGATGLTKTNTGTLSITNLNTYSGVTLISGGVVEAATLANGGSPSSIGSAAADATKLVLDGGTLRYTGPTVAIDRPATLNSGGGTVSVSTSGSSLSVGALSGAGALTKSGTGSLILPLAGSYAGGSLINGGTLQVNNNTAAGSGPITNQNSTLRIQGALVLDNVYEVQGSTALEFNGVGGNNTALRGAWTGSGTVNVYFISVNASQTFTIGGAGSSGGHMWNFSGTVDVGTNTGFLRINNDNTTFNFGSSNATFNLGTGNVSLNQRNGGTTTHLGALIGGPSTRVAGRGNTGASGTTTYSIGGKNLDTTFEGEINNGGGTTAITKVGSCKLRLSGNSIYTGATIIEAGTLQVDGALGATPVSVLGGTLAGNGTIGGSVDIQSGGTLAPGASIGRLSINNTLALASGSFTIMELDKSAGTNDVVAVLTSVSYSGTLVITNLGGTLQQNDTFVLFRAPAGTYSGSFEAFDLPSLPAGLTWDTSGLLVDGSIKVVGPTLNVVTSGSNLDFSWTGAFKLQAQTNSLSIGLSNAWFDYPGGSTSPVTVPMGAANGSVFFRLITQ